MTATALLERAAPSSARGDTADDGVIARGLGVGRQPWTGRVRTAASPDEALEAVEPGDVLVVQFTTPAFNSVLAVCGAVVTAEGGALAHAAVLARELGIAGLIGVGQSISSIPDGATVELDPVAGTLRLVH